VNERMTAIIKNIVKHAVTALGYEIHRLPKNKFKILPPENKFKWLRDFDINTILDIGANAGQFALMIKEFFPKATIYSFEPLKDECERLSEHLDLSSNTATPVWRVFNTGLGDFNGSTKIKRNRISTNSSLLEMTDFFKGAYGDSDLDTWEEEISIWRLDDFVKEKNLELVPALMIKMDVEGYEEKVIRGGNRDFKKGQSCIY